jgi:hypothetical protein
MTKEEALDLQGTVNGILAQALGERSRIGGAVNWGSLRCVDVEMSLLDGVVTVTIEEAFTCRAAMTAVLSLPMIRRGPQASLYRTGHPAILGHRGRRLATAQPSVSKPGRSTHVRGGYGGPDYPNWPRCCFIAE